MASLRSVNELNPIHEDTISGFKPLMDEIVENYLSNENIAQFRNLLNAFLRPDEASVVSLEHNIFKRMENHRLNPEFIEKCRRLARIFYKSPDTLKDLINIPESLPEKKEAKTPAKETAAPGVIVPYYPIGLEYLLSKELEAENKPLYDELEQFKKKMLLLDSIILNPGLNRDTSFKYLDLNKLYPAAKKILKKINDAISTTANPTHLKINKLGFMLIIAAMSETLSDYITMAKSLKQAEPYIKDNQHFLSEGVSLATELKLFDSELRSALEWSLKNSSATRKLAERYQELKHAKNSNTPEGLAGELLSLLNGAHTRQALDKIPALLAAYTTSKKIEDPRDLISLFSICFTILKQTLCKNGRDKSSWIFEEMKGPLSTNRPFTQDTFAALKHFVYVILQAPIPTQKAIFPPREENEKTLKTIVAITLENYLYNQKQNSLAALRAAQVSLDIFSQLIVCLYDLGIDKNTLAPNDTLLLTFDKLIPRHKTCTDKTSFYDFISDLYQNLEERIQKLPDPAPRVVTEEVKRSYEIHMQKFETTLKQWDAEDEEKKAALEKEKIKAGDKTNRKKKHREAKRNDPPSLLSEIKPSAKQEANLPKTTPFFNEDSEQGQLYLAAFAALTEQNRKPYASRQFTQPRADYEKALFIAQKNQDHIIVALCCSHLAESFSLEAAIHLRRGKSHLHNCDEEYQASFSTALDLFTKASRYSEIAIKYFDEVVRVEKSLNPITENDLNNISWELNEVLKQAEEQILETRFYAKKHMIEINQRFEQSIIHREEAIKAMGIEAWRNNPNPKNRHREKMDKYQKFLNKENTIFSQLTLCDSQIKAQRAAFEVLHPPEDLKRLKEPGAVAEDKNDGPVDFRGKLTKLHQHLEGRTLKAPDSAAVRLLLPPEATLWGENARREDLGVSNSPEGKRTPGQAFRPAPGPAAADA